MRITVMFVCKNDVLRLLRCISGSADAFFITTIEIVVLVLILLVKIMDLVYSGFTPTASALHCSVHSR